MAGAALALPAIDGSGRICFRFAVAEVAPTSIPRVFHRIWLGGPMPPEFAGYGETFRRYHPDWKFVHWHEGNLPALRNQRLFDGASTYAQKSDIARYEILYEHGGIYVDTDVECLKPFDPLLRDGVTCFCANEARLGLAVSNAILGAVPRHPFLEEVIQEIPSATAALPDGGPSWQTGPEMFSRVLLERKKRGTDDVVVFPGRLFYPHHWNPLVGPNRRQRPTNTNGPFPDAYAVHHWAADWKQAGPTAPPSIQDAGFARRAGTPGGPDARPAARAHVATPAITVASGGMAVVVPGTAGVQGITVTAGATVMAPGAHVEMHTPEGSIPHFWHTLPGYFTFPDFYAWLAEQMPRDRPSRIVEVGVYQGQSAAFLGVELIRRSRPCKIDLVDLFQASEQTVADSLRPIAEVVGEIISGDSAGAAARYANGTLDAVFLDADHDYASVSRDIDAWRYKVRAGGILAGHDFCKTYPGVLRAVTERFPRRQVWQGLPFGPSQSYFPVWQVRL